MVLGSAIVWKAARTDACLAYSSVKVMSQVCSALSTSTKLLSPMVFEVP